LIDCYGHSLYSVLKKHFFFIYRIDILVLETQNNMCDVCCDMCACEL